MGTNKDNPSWLKIYLSNAIKDAVTEYYKVYKQFIYTTMLMGGTINRYLADINQQAEQMFHRLIDEMAQKQGVTEQLKAENQMEWVQQMNACKAQAEEIVKFELIYD